MNANKSDAAPLPCVSNRNTALLRQLAPGWKCRVLIVDDDEMVRSHLRRLFKAAHFDVQVASTAFEALNVLGALHFHILLTDLRMPDMDGRELCRRVRTGFVAGFVYIVVLTARGTKTDTLLSLVAGADDHIVKGSSDAEILTKMEEARRIALLDCVSRLSARKDADDAPGRDIRDPGQPDVTRHT